MGNFTSYTCDVDTSQRFQNCVSMFSPQRGHLDQKKKNSTSEFASPPGLSSSTTSRSCLLCTFVPVETYSAGRRKPREKSNNVHHGHTQHTAFLHGSERYSRRIRPSTVSYLYIIRSRPIRQNLGSKALHHLRKQGQLQLYVLRCFARGG